MFFHAVKKRSQLFSDIQDEKNKSLKNDSEYIVLVFCLFMLLLHIQVAFCEIKSQLLFLICLLRGVNESFSCLDPVALGRRAGFDFRETLVKRLEKTRRGRVRENNFHRECLANHFLFTSRRSLNARRIMIYVIVSRQMQMKAIHVN